MNDRSVLDDEFLVEEKGMNSYLGLKEIDRGFYENEFVLHFQPIVDSTRRLVGYEALIRWEHSELGLLYPDVILPLIHKHNYDVRMDYYVIEKAIIALSLQDEKVLPRLNINLTAMTMNEEKIGTYIVSLLLKYGVEGDRLCIELTEDYEILRYDHIGEVISGLKKLGIRFALDDFGSGYAALSQVIKCDFDMIKIDKTMVENITSNERKCQLLINVVEVFLKLGMEVIIEGIESKEEFTIIKDHVYVYLQGYYFGKPQSLERCQLNLYMG